MASSLATYSAFSDDNCDLSCVFDADFHSCFLNGILTRSWALWKTKKWVLDATIDFCSTHGEVKFILHAVLSLVTGPLLQDRTTPIGLMIKRKVIVRLIIILIHDYANPINKHKQLLISFYNYCLFLRYKFRLCLRVLLSRRKYDIILTMPTLDFLLAPILHNTRNRAPNVLLSLFGIRRDSFIKLISNMSL